MTFAAWLSVGILGSALGAPLLYALKTLFGMRHKTIYPLLRTRGADGRSQPCLRSTHRSPPQT
jgi:hypothetical protein